MNIENFADNGSTVHLQIINSNYWTITFNKGIIMELTEREEQILKNVTDFAAGKDFELNPDENVVKRVVKGLARNEENKGKQYCPCRLVTGNPEMDDKIVCPCVFHEQEIAERGMCHCQLYVKG